MCWRGSSQKQSAAITHRVVLSVRLAKPKMGEACNGCGYCCATEPCSLAAEYLHCSTGPCVALEVRDGRTVCGLVRNPLGYLWKAVHPDADDPVLEPAPEIEEAHRLSVELAAALGLGKGCDADDDEHADAWSWSLRACA